mmetsp:Transcript_5581/g.11650  ORF Transcript_5581/g.11650 Transcript_5581/m.11650 type:complete len:399 (-) Transcript_5581:127-1323(-)
MIARIANTFLRAARSDKGIVALICFVLAITTYTSFQYDNVNNSLTYEDSDTRRLLQEMILADGSKQLKELLHMLDEFSPEELKELAEAIEVHRLMKDLDESEYLNRFHRHRIVFKDLYTECVFREDEPPQNGECYKMLAPEVKSKKAWFFFGDSQMGKYFNALDYPYIITSKKETDDLRCGFLDYVHLPRSEEWVYPQYNQGPAKFGRKNHFCSDVASAGNRRFESDSTEGSNFMELLTVDFASDVEQQTRYTNTTQETATLHVANQLQLRGLTYEDSVCVVNVGLHDQKLCESKSDSHCLVIYVTNVKVYLNLLYNVCGSIIWLSTTPVRDTHNPNYPQRNDRMEIMNEKIREVLAKFDNGYFVDVWERALGNTFVDNAHFTQDFYDNVAGLFSSLM